MKKPTKLLKGIAIGYLIKNYSYQFRKDVSISKVCRVKHLKDTYRVEMFRTDFFGIQIDLTNKKIIHLGCYSRNRNYPSDKIIEYNISKLNLHHE